MWNERGNVDDEQFEAIHRATPAELARILAAGVPVDLRDSSGLHALTDAATETWRFDALEAAGFRLPEDDVAHALHFACAARNVELFERLLPRAAVQDPSVWGPIALAGAVASADPSLVRRLVAAGAAANARDVRGRTALHYAAGFERCIPVARVLVDAGADVHACDNEGLTALDYVEQRVGIARPDECPRREDEVAMAAWLRAVAAADGIAKNEEVGNGRQ